MVNSAPVYNEEPLERLGLEKGTEAQRLILSLEMRSLSADDGQWKGNRFPAQYTE